MNQPNVPNDGYAIVPQVLTSEEIDHLLSDLERSAVATQQSWCAAFDEQSSNREVS